MDTDTLPNDLAVFMMSQFVVTAILLLPFVAADPSALGHFAPPLGASGYRSPSTALAVAFPYAFAGALCFCIAVTAQAVSVITLPETVAFPLTQLNVIVAGFWGIVLYNELDSSRLIAAFSFAVFLDLVGAAMLSWNAK